MLKLIFPFLLIFRIYANDAGFFTSVSALYWKAGEQGLIYTLKSSSAQKIAPNATFEEPQFEWDFGFKFNLGYRVPHDRWEFGLLFTSFQTHTDTEKHGGIFYPVWQQPQHQSNTFADAFKMHWRLHLGLLDAYLSKNIFESNNVIATPALGIQVGWIRQKFNLMYFGGSYPTGEEIYLRMKNKFWGIGPRASISLDWKLLSTLSLFADGKASLLYGEFYLHQDEDTLGTDQKLLGVHSIFRASAPILEGNFGIRWQRTFSKSLKRLIMILAWDELLFFSQNQLMLFLNGNSQGMFAGNEGDLSVQGIELLFRLDF